MADKRFPGRNAAAFDDTKSKWRIESNVTCARIGCGLQTCVRDVPLRAADAALLERSTLVRNFERGEKVFSEGEPASGLYCVRSGVVLLTYKDAFRADKAVRMVGPGDLMGYRSFFAEEAHANTAEALTSCHICFLPRSIVARLTQAYPLFTRLLFRTLTRDRGVLEGAFIREQHLPILVRFIDFLRVMEKRFGMDDGHGGVRVYLPIMRRQIASVLSARPESVARAITELEREGLALFEGRNVTIPDANALYQRIDGVPGPHRAEKQH